MHPSGRLLGRATLVRRGIIRNLSVQWSVWQSAWRWSAHDHCLPYNTQGLCPSWTWWGTRPPPSRSTKPAADSLWGTAWMSSSPSCCWPRLHTARIPFQEVPGTCLVSEQTPERDPFLELLASWRSLAWICIDLKKLYFWFSRLRSSCPQDGKWLRYD